MPYLPEALSVSLRFALWFFILPFLLMPRRLALLDRLALGFVLMCSGAVVVAQGLSAIRLYEPLSLWAATLIAAWLMLRLVSGLDMTRWLIGILGYADAQRKLAASATWVPRFSWTAKLQSLTDGRRLAAIALGLMGAGVMIWSIWLRYAQSLRSPVITASDGYLHLAWMKYLEGVGGFHMFQDGVYPFGYHAILSVLHFLSFQDPHTLFRFIGPIAGLLLVLSVGYAAYALGLRPAASLLSMAVIGLGFGSPLPYSPGRHISPLPQEFAALFVLPGAVSAWRYLRTGDRMAGTVALLSAFLTAAIHPYSLIYLALAVTVLAVVGWATRAFDSTRVFRLAIMAAALTAASAVPMAISLMLGRPWHSSFAYVASQVGSLAPATGWARIWTGNLLLNLGLVLGLALLVTGAVRLIRGDRERSPLLISLGILLLMLFTQAYGATGVPVLMDPSRSGLFFALFLALAIAVAADLLWRVGPLPALWQSAFVGVLIVLQVTLWRPTVALPLGEYEYPEAAEAYVAISRQHQPLLWTVVAPQEQYDEVLGVGLHVQLYTFALEHTFEQMRDPAFQLLDWPTQAGPAVIPTEDVFVFVEKQPLGSQVMVAPDATVAIPSGLSSDEVLARMYMTPEGRGRLQSRVWGLMEAYRTTHPEQVNLFTDNARLRVYHVHRTLPARPN